MPESDARPSKKQRELLSFIEGFIRGYGYGPSYREIMRALNYKSVSTVAIHVDNLIAKGLLAKKDNSARSLEIVGQASPSAQPVMQAAASSDHQQWLVRQVQERIDSYNASPDGAQREQLFALIMAVRVIVDHATAEALQKQLQTPPEG